MHQNLIRVKKIPVPTRRKYVEIIAHATIYQFVWLRPKGGCYFTMNTIPEITKETLEVAIELLSYFWCAHRHKITTKSSTERVEKSITSI